MLYRRIQMEKRNLLQDLWDYNIIICLLRAKLITYSIGTCLMAIFLKVIQSLFI